MKATITPCYTICGVTELRDLLSCGQSDFPSHEVAQESESHLRGRFLRPLSGASMAVPTHVSSGGVRRAVGGRRLAHWPRVCSPGANPSWLRKEPDRSGSLSIYLRCPTQRAYRLQYAHSSAGPGPMVTPRGTITPRRESPAANRRASHRFAESARWPRHPAGLILQPE